MAGFGMKGGHKPHRRRSYSGGSGMKGYSRYGSIGKGLSDQAQHVYNTAVRTTLTSGVDRAMFDREVMTFRLNGKDVFKGLYNIPGAPRYAGGKCDYAVLTPPQQVRVMGALRKVNRDKEIGTSQFGAMTTGRSRGYPSWMIGMINKARASEDTSGDKKLPMGLALVALKVLL